MTAGFGWKYDGGCGRGRLGTGRGDDRVTGGNDKSRRGSDDVDVLVS